ncbi:MAG: ABC transporter ATP-binding protein [Ferroplasma sp.]|uniref:ABC transporter ATP-binding protein n=1 Tax=Ferroplasma sp. TaxID=2591003 RepID=UPI002815FF84|nr:ABC transporter ATP-binding protein [Ferroplasma sp.]WMT51656.1 MAG: ABC transporter ATP-binding protein [Ferroplasma sp.]
MLNTIEINNIYKRYGTTNALNGINLSIQGGQIYGVLGPNGSGKTTLLKIIAGILPASSGDVSVNGISVNANPDAIKSITGYIPETPALYESLTPVEYFNFLASVFKIDEHVLKDRITAFANALEIGKYLDEFIGSLSFGTKQKVAIIGSLIHDPQVIVMDEGMNGLDPKSSKIIKELLKDITARGKTVIFSTHIMEIAETVCDTISILYNGNIAGTGNLAQLREEAGSSNNDLEGIFLKLTGDEDLDNLLDSLRDSIK